MRTALLDDGAVAAVVGTRVHPHARPEGGALPAIVYELGADAAVPTLAGSSDLYEANMLLVCLAETRAAAASLAELVRAALDAISGTYASHAILFVRITSSSVAYEAPSDGSDSGTYSTLITASIHHRH